MTEELDILRIVAESPSISQRKIAEQIGTSLGQVNFLIKKCTKKGLIKIEGQTSKSIRYNLTPRGIAEKAALTLEYVKISYGAVIVLTDKIRSLAENYEAQDKKIYVYGAEDEMMEIVKLALNGNRLSWKLWQENISAVEKEDLLTNADKYVVFCWDANHKDKLENNSIEAINVLE